MIVDPSFESLRLSAKIAELSHSIGKPIYFCLNKITAENEQTMVDAVSKHGPVICKMPLEADLSRAGLTGEELTGSYPQITEMAKRLNAALSMV